MFEIILRIVAIIAPILIIVAIGYLFARLRKPDITGLNKLTLDLLGPMLVFSNLAAKDFNLLDQTGLLIGAILIVLGSGLLAWPVARLFRLDPATFVPPNMFGNTGNMGLPLALFAFGAAALPAAVAMFAVTNLLHFTLGSKIVDPKMPLRKVLFNPMNVAAFFGCLLALLPYKIPSEWMVPFKMVGDAAIPLMLFALGVRMLDLNWNSVRAGLLAGITCPVFGLLIAWLAMPYLSLSAQQQALLFVFSSLPPAVLNFLIAEKTQQEPQTVAAIVLIGNLLALVFVPIGLWLGLSQLHLN